MNKLIKGSIIAMGLSSSVGFYLYEIRVGLIDLTLFALSILSLGLIAGMEIGRILNREIKSNKQVLDFWDIVKSRGEL